MHETTETHIRLSNHVKSIIDIGGEPLKYDIKASLVTKHVPPIIEWFPYPEERQVDGIWIIRNPAQGVPVFGNATHRRWKTRNFKHTGFKSLSPSLQLNGMQTVGPDGILSGHSHLHVVSLEQFQQLMLYRAKVPGVDRPSTYSFFGGKDYYDINDTTIPGESLIRMPHITNPIVERGVNTVFWFGCVHEDDAPIAAVNHEEDCANLFTVVRWE
jgi:hypothetical protein